MHAAEQDRPDVAARRAGWPEEVAAQGRPRLIFLDECGVNTRMTRGRGRAPGGERLLAKVPHGHYQTCTLIAAVGLAGPLAPWVFEGPMDGELFRAWIREGLAPHLRDTDLVILDNLATHKVAGIREAIEQTGARLLYLPAYSPDLNPIENLWSKLKQALRSLAPRTFPELLAAVRTAFATITLADCAGFFAGANYDTLFM